MVSGLRRQLRPQGGLLPHSPGHRYLAFISRPPTLSEGSLLLSQQRIAGAGFSKLSTFNSRARVIIETLEGSNKATLVVGNWVRSGLLNADRVEDRYRRIFGCVGSPERTSQSLIYRPGE